MSSVSFFLFLVAALLFLLAALGSALIPSPMAVGWMLVALGLALSQPLPWRR